LTLPSITGRGVWFLKRSSSTAEYRAGPGDEYHAAPRLPTPPRPGSAGRPEIVYMGADGMSGAWLPMVVDKA
jgi:hypothetical protein